MCLLFCLSPVVKTDSRHRHVLFLSALFQFETDKEEVNVWKNAHNVKVTGLGRAVSGHFQKQEFAQNHVRRADMIELSILQDIKAMSTWCFSVMRPRGVEYMNPSFVLSLFPPEQVNLYYSSESSPGHSHVSSLV